MSTRSPNLKHSGYLVTITANNQRFTGAEDNFRDTTMRFAKAISDLYTDKGLQQITKCKVPDITIDQLFATNELIKNVDCTSTLEIGPTTGVLHCHSVLIYHHYTKLQIDKPSIQTFMSNHGFDKCHCNFRFFSDSSTIMKEYIGKTLDQVKQAIKQKNDKLIATTQ